MTAEIIQPWLLPFLFSITSTPTTINTTILDRVLLLLRTLPPAYLDELSGFVALAWICTF